MVTVGVAFGTLTVCVMVAAGPPLHKTVWPVYTCLVEHPSLSVTVRLTA
jgi:hypothetical protein